MSKKSISYIEKTILIMIAIIPLVYFNQIKNVPIKAFILGAGSWGLGNIFKIILHQVVLLPLHKRNTSIFLTSLINGLFSGFFELFATYIIIILMKEKFIFDYDAIISFGLAIGSMEIIVAVSKGAKLFKGTTLEQTTGKIVDYLDNLKGSRNYIFNLLLPVAERIIVVFIHISTRGLVFLTIITNSAVPIILALLVFIIADGILGYYYNISGKLATSKGYIQIHLYLFILSLISTIIFLILMSPYKEVAL